MNRRLLAMLVTLNALLLAVLTLVWHDQTPPAESQAQAFGGGGNFTMVSGFVRQGQQDVVYIIDQNTGGVAAVTFSKPLKRFNGIGVRSLRQDMERLEAGGGR